MPCPAKMQCCLMKSNEVTGSSPSAPVCPRSLLLPFPSHAPGTVGAYCLLSRDKDRPQACAWAVVTSEHTEPSCFAELEMYLPESYVYKGIKIKSHRAATHFSLEKYKSLRNSSGLDKAVTFSCHGNAHPPPLYAGPTLDLASCRLEDSAVGQKDHWRGAGRPVVWSQLRCSPASETDADSFRN